MQIVDLESRLDSLLSENRLLQDARARAERSLDDAVHDHDVQKKALTDSIETRDVFLKQKDSELSELRTILDELQSEISRLKDHNEHLSSTSRELPEEHLERFRNLEDEHEHTKAQFEDSTRELDELRQKHASLSTGMEGIVAHEVALALQRKDAELEHLRNELEAAKQQVRALQQQILASRKSDDLLQIRDEDYFDSRCQELCQHVQQWVLRFSKFSDMKACRSIAEIKDEKIVDRFENAILDGTDVDIYLSDRIKRRDVFMSVTMTMVWEYVFTRYLFGMDREQRQKLKSLERTLSEVGPPAAVNKWRATTLTMLSKRGAFIAQRDQDTQAVAEEIYQTLAIFLPPPSQLVNQIMDSLLKVMATAVDLSIEMRTQRAEYIMLPPLQPEYDTNGDLARTINFNAALMNERSGEPNVENEDLDASGAVVRLVLFPLVVKRGDDDGLGAEEIVVCPAQVLVPTQEDKRPGKRVRVMSGMGGRGNVSVGNVSVAASTMDAAMGGVM
jgi:myosin heavy subunit